MDLEEWVGLGHMTTGHLCRGGTVQHSSSKSSGQRTRAGSETVGSKNRYV